MIDSVASSVSAGATLKNAGNSGDRNEDGFGFIQLLDVLSSAMNDQTCVSSVLQSAAAAANSTAKGWDSVADEGEMEQGPGTVSDAGVAAAAEAKRENGSLAALEMVLALISATASRIQPWQVKGLGSGASSANDSKEVDAIEWAVMGNLPKELLNLTPAERSAIIRVALSKSALGLNEEESLQSLDSQAPLGPGGSGEIGPKGTDGISKGSISPGVGGELRQEWLATAHTSAYSASSSYKDETSQKDAQDFGGLSGNVSSLLGTEEVQQAADPLGQQTWSESTATSSLSTSIVEQIARKAQLLKGRGRPTITIQLDPKELGQVRVHVSSGPDGLQVRLGAESSDAKQIIQSSLAQLKRAFESQGLTVDRFEVMVASNFSHLSSQQDQGQRQSLLRPQPTEHFLWSDDADADTVDSFEARRPNSLVDYRI